MYLINTENFKLENFDGSRIPLYAILSHTWGEDEITFQDMQLGVADKKAGYEKVNQTCLIAKSHGFDYVWIDTCCIDKTSSMELSEAINSMYHWYQESGICYAYLADISMSALDQLSNSRWFIRGWTLQELIAPSIVIFLDRDWQQIGTKSSLGSKISKITSIPERILQGANPRSASIAERMSWAANRETTRIEDLAYCLLGIFGVHMPLLYGEREGAFNRLQEEIIKVSDDHSLFAWKGLASPFNSLLASSPVAFSKCGKINPLDSDSALSSAITINNQGIHLKLRIQSIGTKLKNTYLAILPCMVLGSSAETVGIRVKATPGMKGHFTRTHPGMFELVSLSDFTLLEETEQLLCFQRERQIASESQLPFERAFERGNKKLVKFLLEKGAHFGFQCDIGPKLLFKAIEDRDDATVRVLLENGADPEWRDDAGQTALIFATQTEHEETVKLLLERGVNIESKDDEGGTAISWAAANGDEAVVKLLLEKGADPESRDDYGRTPLSLTAENWEEEAVVKLLLENGANPNSKDYKGRTPLSWAASYKDKEVVVELLLENGADPESRDHQGRTPLSWAASYGDQEAVVELLLENSADPESRDDEGRTPLSWAVSGKSQEAVVKLLLENGADPESRDDEGGTPLSWAVSCDNQEAVVKLLLEKGADPESRDHQGRTPLSWVVSHLDQAAVVKLLLEKVANPESRDDHGRTPIDLEAENGNEAIVRLLLAKVADPGLRNEHGRTPLSSVARKGHSAKRPSKHTR